MSTLARYFLVVIVSFAAACRPAAHRATERAEAHDSCGDCEDESAMCKEHGVLEAECGICQPDRLGQLEAGASMKVRLPSRDSVALTGVEMSPAQIGQVSDTLECLGEVIVHPDRRWEIRSPVEGRIEDVSSGPGAAVGKGDALLRIRSPDIAALRISLGAAARRLEREREMSRKGMGTAQELEDAESRHLEWIERARVLDLNGPASPDVQDLLILTAPAAGEIVTQSVAPGARVAKDDLLLELQDRQVLRVVLHVPPAAMPRLQKGMSLVVAAAANDRIATGTIRVVSGALDPHTRLARAEADVPDPARVFRPGEMVRIRVNLSSTRDAILVPASAVHMVGATSVVFVRLEDDLFDARRIQPGQRTRDMIEIARGLGAGESIVVRNGAVLKSQLLASRLGAGCAHD